ncbi:MAG TPA: hypothetical protein DCF73_01630 [Rhodobiaceae bacterium]|nr:hypothetical protein [Rhodobiaceae bacterium]
MTEETVSLNARARPMEAWRALKKIRLDKEQTDEVFRFVNALGAGRARYLATRFKADLEGRALLSERLSLLPTLCDRERLKSLPEGTLGRAYHDFVHGENLTPEALVEASAGGREMSGEHEEEAYMRDRVRDAHDLWHVVTGYGREGIGELCILTFSYAQLRHRGVGILCAIGSWLTIRRTEGIDVLPLVREAYRRGRDCAWLPPVAWERLMELPLEEVRSRLALPPAPEYCRQKTAIMRDEMRQKSEAAERRAA